MQSPPFPVLQPGDMPVSPALEALLDLAAQVRSPNEYYSFARDIWPGLIGSIMLGIGAWLSNSVFIGFMATISLVCSIQAASDRRSQKQLKLIVTVLRDLQNRCPKAAAPATDEVLSL